FLGGSLGVTVAVYAVFALVWGLPEVRKWDEVRTAYPMESVSGRLDYENRLHRAPAGAHDPQRLFAFEERVGRKADESDAWRRTRALEKLHAGAVKQSVDSPGFGAARPRRADPHDLKYIDSRGRPDELPGPIPQPVTGYDSPADTTTGMTAAGP